MKKRAFKRLLRTARNLYSVEDPEPFSEACRRAARLLDNGEVLLVGLACGGSADGELVYLAPVRPGGGALRRAIEDAARRALAAGSPGAIVTFLDKQGGGGRLYVEPMFEDLPQNR